MTMLFEGTQPTRAHDHDAGLDLRASDWATLRPGGHALIPTGTIAHLDPGTVGLVCPRSGLATEGVTVLNSPGVVDAGYRGEIFVNLINHNTQPFMIRAGDRIAQLVVLPLTVTPEGAATRGAAGHGSTGR